jgi:hypothetical protein
LDVVNLSIDVVRAPPIELWPNLASRIAAPADVQELLLTPLTGLRESGASEQA